MIYLVRHGETELNVARRHQGHIDSALTELGLRQARSAGRALAQLVDTNSAVIFASPLGRALTTAQIIAAEIRVTTPIIVDDDLREISMGSAEGMTETEMSERWPGHAALSARDSLSLVSPDGESLITLSGRLRCVLRRAATHQSISQILVSHGVCSRVLRALHLGLDPTAAAQFDCPQNALFALEIENVRAVPFVVD